MNKIAATKTVALARYYDFIFPHLGAKGVRRFHHQVEFRYKEFKFDGLNVIDIGGGNGIHSFCAAASGTNDFLSHRA